MLRNLFIYHVISLGPLLVLLVLIKYDIGDFMTMLILVIIYGFLYRPIIDYYKLKSKGLVEKSSYIKSLGFQRFKYYSQLMFEA
jgi:Zn-dependent protease with chaperone function